MNPTAAAIPQSPRSLWLGLDLGTTNVKAIVVDNAGTEIARANQRVSVVPVGDGGVEQDIEEIWRATLAVLANVARTSDPSGIGSIGVSSQGGALQLLEGDGRPHGRVISWLDQRARRFDAAFTDELGRDWFRTRIGHGLSGLAIGHLLRVRSESPSAIQWPRRIGFVGDVIVSRLCGRAAHDHTSCGLTLLHNPSMGTYDPDLLDRLGINPGQLPEILPATQPAGLLRPEVAVVTGLPAGTPISPAVHDQYAAALGTGATEPGTVMVGAGTAWVLLAVVDRLTPPVVDEGFVCSHLIGGLFGQMLSMVNGGSTVEWALGLIGMSSATVTEVDDLILRCAAGCDGLRFWPFMTPEPPAGLADGIRGRLSGLQLKHGRQHLVRAVVESLACELHRHLLILRSAGLPAQRLVMGGAVSESNATPQILANVTGLPVLCTGAGRGSLLGAAILARHLAHPRQTLRSLADQMLGAARRVEPDRDASRYGAMFQEYFASVTACADRAAPLVW